MADRRRVVRWAALFAAVVVTRVVFLPGTLAEPVPASENERTAACLADRGFLGDPYPGYDRPSAHCAPVHPILLAAGYTLAPGPESRRVVGVGLSFAALFLGVALLPAVGRELVGSGLAGWLAAWAFALTPAEPWVQLSGRYETVWSLPLSGVVVLRMRRVQRDGWTPRRAGCFGAAVGFAALLNPSFLAVFALFAGLEVLATGRRALVGAVLAGVVVCGVLAPWTVRNAVVLGTFCPVRSNLGLELAIGNNDYADGNAQTATDIGNPSRSVPWAVPAEVEKLREVGEAAYMQARQREAVAWIRGHPERFAELTVRRTLMFWLPPISLWEPVGTPAPQAWVQMAVAWLAAVLGAVGLWQLWKRDPAAARVAVAVLAGLSAAYTMTLVDPRHMLPARGVLLVLAADGLLFLLPVRAASPQGG